MTTKIKRTLIGTALAVITASALVVTTACGDSSSSAAPTNFVLDTSSGAFSFDALEDRDTYTAGISKIINDATGATLESSSQAATMTLSDGTEAYVWSEQVGSKTGLSDSDGDGVISGTFTLRKYSNSASYVGDTYSFSDLPVGNYVATVIADATTDLDASDAATYEFTVAGDLAEPTGFSASINDDGYIEITQPSSYATYTITSGGTISCSYYLWCLLAGGMPEYMQFDVTDADGTVVETLTLDDFGYTNTVIGPTKSFTFNNATVTGSTALDADADYTVVVTAVGDGDQIGSSSATLTVGETTTSSGSTDSGSIDSGVPDFGTDSGSTDLTVEITSIDITNATVDVHWTIGNDTTISCTLTAADETTDGSSYSYTYEGANGDETITGTVELLEDGTVTATIDQFGPFSATTCTGTWTEEDGVITVTMS